MGKCLQNGFWSAELLMLGVTDEDMEGMNEEENDFVLGVISLAEVENDAATGEHAIQLALEWDDWLDASEIGNAIAPIDTEEWVDGAIEDNGTGQEQEHELLMVSVPEVGGEAGAEFMAMPVESMAVHVDQDVGSETRNEDDILTYAQWLHAQDQESEAERALFFRNIEYHTEEARLERGRELARGRQAARVARLLHDEE